MASEAANAKAIIDPCSFILIPFLRNPEILDMTALMHAL
jgi:hypothetical protein